jgi:large subunit ribosomal protein L22
MQAKAIARTVGVTPRKARLVVDLVRGKTVVEALEILSVLNKSAVTPVTKVIKSAVANATNNFNMDESSLYIKEAYVDDSIRMRRYLPRAKGSASGLVKRTCHITIVVADE